MAEREEAAILSALNENDPTLAPDPEAGGTYPIPVRRKIRNPPIGAPETFEAYSRKSWVEQSKHRGYGVERQQLVLDDGAHCAERLDGISQVKQEAP
jgi:hypothetical protein